MQCLVHPVKFETVCWILGYKPADAIIPEYVLACEVARCRKHAAGKFMFFKDGKGML